MFCYFSRHGPERMGEAGSPLCWHLVDALIWSSFFSVFFFLLGGSFGIVRADLVFDSRLHGPECICSQGTYPGRLLQLIWSAISSSHSFDFLGSFLVPQTVTISSLTAPACAGRSSPQKQSHLLSLSANIRSTRMAYSMVLKTMLTLR